MTGLLGFGHLLNDLDILAIGHALLAKFSEVDAIRCLFRLSEHPLADTHHSFQTIVIALRTEILICVYILRMYTLSKALILLNSGVHIGPFISLLELYLGRGYLISHVSLLDLEHAFPAVKRATCLHDFVPF